MNLCINLVFDRTMIRMSNFSILGVWVSWWHALKCNSVALWRAHSRIWWACLKPTNQNAWTSGCPGFSPSPPGGVLRWTDRCRFFHRSLLHSSLAADPAPDPENPGGSFLGVYRNRTILWRMKHLPTLSGGVRILFGGWNPRVLMRENLWNLCCL